MRRTNVSTDLQNAQAELKQLKLELQQLQAARAHNNANWGDVLANVETLQRQYEEKHSTEVRSHTLIALQQILNSITSDAALAQTKVDELQQLLDTAKQARTYKDTKLARAIQAMCSVLLALKSDDQYSQLARELELQITANQRQQKRLEKEIAELQQQQPRVELDTNAYLSALISANREQDDIAAIFTQHPADLDPQAIMPVQKEALDNAFASANPQSYARLLISKAKKMLAELELDLSNDEAITFSHALALRILHDHHDAFPGAKEALLEQLQAVVKSDCTAALNNAKQVQQQALSSVAVARDVDPIMQIILSNWARVYNEFVSHERPQALAGLFTVHSNAVDALPLWLNTDMNMDDFLEADDLSEIIKQAEQYAEHLVKTIFPIDVTWSPKLADRIPSVERKFINSAIDAATLQAIVKAGCLQTVIFSIPAQLELLRQQRLAAGMDAENLPSHELIFIF